MLKLKKLPIGIQSYSRMIEGNFLYIDKTSCIHDLIDSGDCYFLSRPRRFGKSLLLSTFNEIFSGNKKLFDTLAIAKTDYDWAEHPVIHLSFSSMNTQSASQLRNDLEWSLVKIARKNGINIDDAPSLQTKFTELIEQLALKNRVVILIDEEETKFDDIRKIKLTPLLWQAGYLTIDSYNPETQNYKLKYPNEEVKVSFFNLLSL